MDAILNAIAAVLSKSENASLLVSVLFNIGLGWAHVKFRAEDRLDRKDSTEALKEVTQALNAVRNVLSALTGKPIV